MALSRGLVFNDRDPGRQYISAPDSSPPELPGVVLMVTLHAAASATGIMAMMNTTAHTMHTTDNPVLVIIIQYLLR